MLPGLIAMLLKIENILFVHENYRLEVVHLCRTSCPFMPDTPSIYAGQSVPNLWTDLVRSFTEVDGILIAIIHQIVHAEMLWHGENQSIQSKSRVWGYKTAVICVVPGHKSAEKR